MQGLRYRPVSDDVARGLPSISPLSIDGEETTEKRIERLISENPVVVFSRTSCCMCHVMKRLLVMIGVHPTVIELDDAEIERAKSTLRSEDSQAEAVAPALFIGGSHVGGLEDLMALHLSGRLLPELRGVGAVWLS